MITNYWTVCKKKTRNPRYFDKPGWSWAAKTLEFFQSRIQFNSGNMARQIKKNYATNLPSKKKPIYATATFISGRLDKIQRFRQCLGHPQCQVIGGIAKTALQS